MAKAKKKSTKRTSRKQEILVVSSKVKAVVARMGMRSDGKLMEAISGKVYEMITRAGTRAKVNRRSTIKPEDL